MTEVTHGVRSALSIPTAYSAVQRILGGKRVHRCFVEEHVRPRPGERVLDIGCGPGTILELMPEVSYLGVDSNAAYIEAARGRYGERAEFHVVDVESDEVPGGRDFDVAIAHGLLHHLDDGAARRLFSMAAGALGEEGRLVTLDCAFVEGQHRLARSLIERDRGRSVRTPEGYRRLAEERFGDIGVTVRDDLLRLPYTHAILECAAPRR